MKKHILVLAMVVLTAQLVVAQEYYTKDVSQLPAKAQEFVKKHFPKETISYLLVDKEFASTEYEIALSNGQEITFDRNGEWKEIEGKKRALPESVIPAVVATIVTARFPNVAIEHLEREYWGYEVELMNGLELKIDKKGKLIEIDD